MPNTHGEEKVSKFAQISLSSSRMLVEVKFGNKLEISVLEIKLRFLVALNKL